MTHRCMDYSKKGEPCEGEWKVVDRYCNHSAFSGYRCTPSDYSSVKCMTCRTHWRTKAAYVSSLPDATTEERLA